MSFITGQYPDRLAAYVKTLWPEWADHCHEIEVVYSNFAHSLADDRIKVMLLGTPEPPVFPKGRILGVIYLMEQPTCCGLAVSVYTSLNKELRGKGLGRKLLYIKEQLATHLGYSAIQVTIPWATNTMLNDGGSKHTAEIHIIRSTPGWELDYTFVNRRTFNVISVFHKILWNRQNDITREGGNSYTATRDCRCSVCLAANERAAQEKQRAAESRVQDAITNPIDGGLVL